MERGKKAGERGVKETDILTSIVSSVCKGPC